MRNGLWANLAWLTGWAALVALGSVAIVRADIAQRRTGFQEESRIAHRLLSQRAAQHDAILATLSLLASSVHTRDNPEQRLAAVYPQLLAVLRRDDGSAWPAAGLQQAELRSRASRHAELGPVDAQTGQFTLVLAAEPSSFALRIDARSMVPWEEWPVARAGPVHVALAHADRTLVLQPGQPANAQPFGLTEGFVFTKRLAPESQPFELRLRRATGPADWPWMLLAAWILLASLALAAFATWRRARQSSRRAQEMLRFGQVARLNTMGELAAGMAHELNQPLAAIVANAQAVRRMLADDAPALDTLRHAIAQVEAQGRRAADVVTRLRRQVETPAGTGPMQTVDLRVNLRSVLDLLESDARHRGVAITTRGGPVLVKADPIALEQIVHNLLANALQALDAVPDAERSIHIVVHSDQTHGILTLRDSGPGIDEEHLARLFEPFFSTRPGGLGLGLSLSEALTQAMHGTLSAGHAPTRGAQFRLALPLADPTP